MTTTTPPKPQYGEMPDEIWCSRDPVYGGSVYGADDRLHESIKSGRTHYTRTSSIAEGHRKIREKLESVGICINLEAVHDAIDEALQELSKLDSMIKEAGR